MPNNKQIGAQAEGYFAPSKSSGDNERYRGDNRGKESSDADQAEQREKTTTATTKAARKSSSK